MKLLHPLAALLLFISCMSLRSEELPKLDPIFNGKDFTGWKLPKEAGQWAIKDGVLIGENDAQLKGSMLYTEKSYRDVIVELEAKWDMDKDCDTGIMLRKPEIQMQLGISGSLKKDMSGSFYIGKYPEEGQAKDAAKLMKKSDWNKFRIQAKGDTFTVWINDTKCVEYKNEKYANEGPIGLQIHPKRAMKVEFRNISVKALDK